MLSSLGITSVRGRKFCRCAASGQRGSFDIILSDYLLDDGRDGQQLLEELRQQQLIPLGTVFMIITGERAYHNVVLVAELAPDDYLIKPFTADQLQARLLKACSRKNFFAPVYRKLDEGAYIGALNACDRLLANSSPFELDVLRLKGEILNALGRHDEAEVIYRDVLARKSVPWARMGLALSLRGTKSLDEAESVARQSSRNSRIFVGLRFSRRRTGGNGATAGSAGGPATGRRHRTEERRAAACRR